MKACSNCFKIKPFDQFYRKGSSYQSRCKQCNAEVCRGYQNRKRAAVGIRPLKETSTVGSMANLYLGRGW